MIEGECLLSFFLRLREATNMQSEFKARTLNAGRWLHLCQREDELNLTPMRVEKCLLLRRFDDPSQDQAAAQALCVSPDSLVRTDRRERLLAGELPVRVSLAWGLADAQ